MYTERNMPALEKNQPRLNRWGYLDPVTVASWGNVSDSEQALWVPKYNNTL